VLAVSPTGVLHEAGAFHTDDAPDDGLSAAGRARTRAAFARGTGHGLLQLGAAEPATMLPPGLAFARDLGKAFVTRLCGLPDLEAERERCPSCRPARPDDELARLAASVPPMPGAEYVDPARLAAWWPSWRRRSTPRSPPTAAACRELLRERSPAVEPGRAGLLHLAENPGDEEYPFAFVATYTKAAARQAKVQHAPLSRALTEAAGDRASYARCSSR